MNNEYKPDGKILTMVFINDSDAETVYPAEAALAHGCLFPALDKPWMPEKGRKEK